ncbi:MAG: isochorismatase family protein [Planctomycetes bacterium]|nr:isochorismatase family protein [Planctomycetota bacterium]
MLHPRLRINDAALLVVDLQTKFAKHIAKWDFVVTNAGILVRMANELAIPVIVTEQNPQSLGSTIPEITGLLPKGTPVFAKTRFSAYTSEVAAQLRSLNRSQVLICGIEAQVCVLQTVLDLAANGRQPFLVTDAISAVDASQIAPAFRRMEHANGISTGTLSAMYELMQDSTHPKFKACLDLAKQICF